MYLRIQEEKENPQKEISLPKSQLVLQHPQSITFQLKLINVQHEQLCISTQPKVTSEPKIVIQPPQIQVAVMQMSQVLTPVESECLKDVEVSGDTYTHTKENRNNCTILLDTIINKGVVKLEILVIKDLGGIGIAEGSAGIRSLNIFAQVFNILVEIVLKETLYYMMMDLVLECSTLTFFVNDEEQKNFVTNIPNIVRIFCYIWVNDVSFRITKFEFLSTPTANHEKGSRALKYLKLAMAQALIVCYSPTSNTKLISSLIVEEMNKNIIQASVENVSQSDVKP
ncbi:MAG: hypothetical protein EZS28_003235 [Streblomastix strix]|uniref:Uncharacterized protein n=1 Tax=Streblomastix strix TaxID=222440 RepID=A0A5J4X3K9_9EUKA|nr:MAG: hypothetical protein EZS28_003235 [Streblomastix strix]